MSLWYDVKKKIYASSPNDNWYISYIKKMCDKLNSTLSARISNHTSSIAERHKADDIDYSEDKTVKQALDYETSSRNSVCTQMQAQITDLNNSSSQMQTQITSLSDNKVDKIEGKGLSTNDLTDKHMLTLDKFDSYDNHTELNGDLVMGGNSIHTPNIVNAICVDCEGEVISRISGITHKLSEKADLSDVKDSRPYVEYALPTTDALSLNTIYNIGLSTDISITLPSAEVGNFIQVDFFSGETAPTVTISATSSALTSDFDFTPEPNTMYSLFFDYGMLKQDGIQEIEGWRFSFAEYTYTPGESGV